MTEFETPPGPRQWIEQREFRGGRAELAPAAPVSVHRTREPPAAVLAGRPLTDDISAQFPESDAHGSDRKCTPTDR